MTVARQRVERPARENPFSRAATAFVGSLVEAWSELRVHRTRVLLSLIGVGVAVTALTVVVAGGAIATQVATETAERYQGRPAMVAVSAYDPQTGVQADSEVMWQAFTGVADRYGIDYIARNGGGQELSAQLPDGVSYLSAQVVDRAYGVMHRTPIEQGEWFSDYDENRLAPAIIVSEDLWVRLGAADLRTHPTITLLGANGSVTAVIVAIISSPPEAMGQDTSVILLADDYLSMTTPQQQANTYFNYEAWLPPDLAADLMPLLQRDIAGELGDGFEVQAYRNDYLAYGADDPLLFLKVAVGGVAVLVLLLGALGLVNIALVTVRHRIREIGIRRSFGATAGRVFFSVMMESVVATVFAGAVGVLVAVLLVRNPITTGFIGEYVQDVPPFPVEAALIGLGAATLVGALAGLLPALVAVRVKVIDAIRY